MGKFLIAERVFFQWNNEIESGLILAIMENGVYEVCLKIGDGQDFNFLSIILHESSLFKTYDKCLINKTFI